LNVIDEKTEEGKKLLWIADLNEIAFMELILLIDVSNSTGKIAFGIVKSCKSKEFEDGNTTLAWEKLKKKYDPVSAPSLVKTERMFRESRLGKNEDPEVRINNLEDLRIKLETMDSVMTDDQFIVQVLNSLTSDYELQMLLLKKQIGNKDNPLSIEDLKEELHLRFKRLSTGQVLCLLGNLKGNAGIVANLAIRQRNVSQSKLTMKNQMLCAIIVRRAAM
jgi:gag-polypeptide of LTR copia-type